MRGIRRFFRKQFSPVIILLSLFLNTFSPFVSLLPKSIAHAQEANEVAPSVSLSFDFPSNNFVMKAQGVNHASYTLKYTTKDGKDVGVENADAKLEEKIFAGTCSKEDCVKDTVSNGQFSFEGLYGDMHSYKKVISFKVIDGKFWTSDSSKWSTSEVVLGQAYKAPQQDGVSVTFTKLPEKPGKLSIEEITLSDDQVKNIGALSTVAYDITSDMKDGDFEYTLTLPNTDKNADAKVQFSEDGKTFVQAEDVSLLKDSLVVKNLDHFTIFVVTNDAPPLSGSACISAGASAGDKCFNTIQNAIAAAVSGDVINLLADLNTNSQISVTKSLTINGNGHTIWPHFAYTNNSNNAVIHITTSNVTIKNLTIDGTYGTNLHGVNIYQASGIVLDTITSKKNDKSGIVINGSSVTAKNIATSDNGLNWSGINVDQGSGVTTPAILTISKTSNHTDLFQIKIDDVRKNVQVVDTDHQYLYTDIGYMRVYSLDKTNPTVPQNGLPNASILNTNVFDFTWNASTDSNLPLTYEFQSTKNPAQTGGVLTNSLWSSGILPSNMIHSSGASDGTWYWQVRAIDAAGNKSAWSQIWTVTLDTTKPEKPTGLKFLSQDRSKTFACGSYVPLQVAIPDWNDITGDPTFSHYEYTSFHPNGDIGLNEQVLTVSELDNTWMPPADGAYGYAVRSVDTAGNKSDWAISAKSLQGSCQVIYDSVKPINPGAPTTSPNPTKSLVQAWSWLASLDTSSGVKGYSQRVLNVLTSTYSSWSWIGNVLGISTNLNDGEWKIELQAEDNAGNKSEVVTSQSLIVDSVAPPVPGNPNPAHLSYVTTHNFTFSWDSVSDPSSPVKYEWESSYGSSVNPDGTFVNRLAFHELSTSSVYSPSTPDNTYYWHVRAIDSVGNASAWSTAWKVIVDATAPQAPTLISPVNNATVKGAILTNSWNAVSDATKYIYESYYNSVATDIRWTQELTTTSKTATNVSDATFWWRVKAVDTAGNISSWSPLWKVTVDNTAPVAPTIAFPSEGSYFKTSPILNDWSDVSDTTGINHYRIEYVYDDGHTFSGAPYREETISQRNHSPALTEQGGVKFRVQAFDNAGNEGTWSEWRHYFYDATAPVLSSKTTYSGWYTGDQTSTFSYTDAKSPIVSGTPVTCVVSTEGSAQTCSVTPNVCDAAGNCNTTSVTSNGVNIDKTAPESTITSPKNSGTESTIVTNTWSGLIEGTATDATSGVDHVLLSIQRAYDGFFYNGEGGWSVGTEETVRVNATGTTSWSYTLPEPSEDTYTIKSHAVDIAGNIENTYTLTIVLDKTIPEVSIALNPVNPDGSNGWYKTNPTITLTANDNYDLSRIEYQWDGTVGSWTTYANPFQVPSEGQHVLYYRSLDTAGNFSETGIKNVKYDTTNLTEGPMHVSVSPDPTSGSTATVKWDEATDNTGINKYEVTWSLNDVSHTHTVGGDIRKDDIDQLTEGVWKITVKAFDGVGNSKEASVNLTVDRTAPQPPVLTLTATGVGTASLSWNSVAGATDYIIWYGTTPGARTYGARVGNVTSYTVGGLAGGTYFFVVRSVDSVNNQSGDSNEVSTGSISGAPGAVPNQPIQGFAPQVLGAATESGELAQPDSTKADENKGSVLGETTISNMPWWIIPLLLVFFFMIFFYMKKRKNQKK